jgi:hypothetical protein
MTAAPSIAIALASAGELHLDPLAQRSASVWHVRLFLDDAMKANAVHLRGTVSV